MNYSSILDRKPSSGKGKPVPAFYTDFNLSRIISTISNIWGEDVEEFYRYLPEDRECEEYRRDVYRDVNREEMQLILQDFLDALKRRESFAAKRESMREEMQLEILYLQEILSYCSAVTTLADRMEQLGVSSEGMKSFLNYLKEYLISAEYREMNEQIAKLQKEMKSFRLKLHYDREMIAVSEGTEEAEYETFLQECFPEHGKQLKSPFLLDEELSNLELEAVKIFRKKHKEFFKEASVFCKKYKKYIKQEVLTFQSEITYYLAFAKFEKSMKEKGFAFSIPAADPQKAMEAVGLYDLALACVNSEEEKEVVSNDFDYRKGENFFVLTGPNQGGKTTFARSLGQLVFFSKMGLSVPAESANVPYFTHILTHFSVEESAESGKGKLMEELTRLVPMMEEDKENAFVVINELFTTAANYDACIMGKKVLEHFIEKNCKGIYVTHLNELSKAHEKVVSLRAKLNEQKVQTYKIERSDAQELAGAAEQVKKYRLTYDQIKERFV